VNFGLGSGTRRKICSFDEHRPTIRPGAATSERGYAFSGARRPPVSPYTAAARVKDTLGMNGKRHNNTNHKPDPSAHRPSLDGLDWGAKAQFCPEERGGQARPPPSMLADLHHWLKESNNVLAGRPVRLSSRPPHAVSRAAAISLAGIIPHPHQRRYRRLHSLRRQRRLARCAELVPYNASQLRHAVQPRTRRRSTAFWSRPDATW